MSLKIPCLLEGTLVRCFADGKEVYKSIENLCKGDFVRTSREGYKRVEIIGKQNITNPVDDERIEDRIYKCSTINYPELTEDLFINGCNSILINKFTNEQREKIIKQLGKVSTTESKYRLPAFIDDKTEPWNLEGEYNLWYIVLENSSEKMNYGIFVNGGLLVESCSINLLKINKILI